MRIPPLYLQATWQRFFAGVFIGAIISWIVFLFIYGELREAEYKLALEQQDKISKLEDKIAVWEEDYNKLNQKNQQLLTIQDITIKFSNEKTYKIDTLSKHTLEEGVYEELKHLINKDIETVAKNKEILMNAIENKTFRIDNKTYTVRVKQLIIFTTVDVLLEIQLAKL